MTLSYFRSGGGRAAVPEGEWFEVQGTSFTSWRQVATPAVGWFGGELTQDESNRLDAAIRGCLAAEPAEPSVARPGATIVHIDLDGTSVSFGSGSAPPGPWAHLDEVCRDVCDAIVDRPTAAIAIELVDGEALLCHRGDNPIDVDLDGASFVAIAWKGWYEEAGRSEGSLDGTPGEVGPGWTRSIPIGELADDDDVTLHVTVEMTIGKGRDATRVAVSHAPDLERPD
jgi:hypothetical protein